MSKLEPLNNYLETQPPKQRIMLYVALVIGIFVIAYFFYISDLSTELSDTEDVYLQKRSELKVLQRKTDIKKLKIIRKNIKKTKEAIQQKKIDIQEKTEKLNTSSVFLIDDSKFAIFLEDTLLKSKNLNVKLSQVSIDDLALPYIGILDIKKQITINGSGKFLDILRFLRFIEEQKILLKLQFLQIKNTKESIKNKNVEFEARFDVIGLS